MNTLTRAVVIAAALAATFGSDATAQEAGRPAPCGAEPDTKTKYVFDAATGAVTGARRYGSRDKLEIFVKNLNPFRYSYTLTAKDTVVAEPSGADLLKHIASLGVAKAPAAPGAPATPPAGKPDAKVMSSEEGKPKEQWAMAAPSAAAVEAARLEGAGNVASKALDGSEAAIRGLGKSVAAQQAVLSQASAPCETLVQAVQRLTTAASETDSGLGTAALALDAYHDAYDKALGVADPEPLRKAKRDLAEFDKRLAAARETYEKLTTVVNGVERVASGGGFYRLIHTGDFNEPTDVALTIARKDETDPKAKGEPLHEVRLNFGGRSRFSMSGGWAVTTLGRQTFARVQGHARASDGAPADLTAVTPVVGHTEDSDQRNGPIAMVHVRIKDWLTKTPTLHLSLGATPKSNDDQLSVEYLAGLSAGLAEERFFATLGFYFGRKESLANGWFLGEAVPEDVAAVPVTRNLKIGVGFALTYKLN